MKETFAGLRIVLGDNQQNELNAVLKENLFWIKDGYLYFISDSVRGEIAARALRILQEWLPYREIQNQDFNSQDLERVEECFYVDPNLGLKNHIYVRKGVLLFNSTGEILPVRQFDKIQFGKSRYFINKLRKEL